MGDVIARTLLFRPFRGIGLLVHGPTTPSDEDWSSYLDALEVYGREVPQGRLLVVTRSNASLTAAQRDALARRAPKGIRSAVVSGSVIARGIVTLIGWVDPSVRAFAPPSIGAALGYLGIPAEDHADVLAEVDAMHDRLHGRAGGEPSRLKEAEMASVIEAFQQRDREFQRELHDARDFQQRLVALPPVTGAKVYSFYEPMGLVGGDLFAISQKGSRIRIFIADATGHGIRAAMTTMFIRHGYESLSEVARPSEVLEALNDNIASAYRSTEMMFTAACADIDTATGAVTVACAGHPPACAVTGGELVVVEADGAPMGVKSGMTFESASLRLGKGDGLYLFTDGIGEARGGQQYFGDARLHETIGRAHAANADVGKAVRSELLGFVGSYSLTDDASFIGVRLD